MLGLGMTVFLGLTSPAQAADSKLEAVLVWATNGPKPKDSELKELSADVAKKIHCFPFKYTNYFEVNRKQFTLREGGSKSVSMSKDCKLTLKTKDAGKVEVTLIGQGKPVGTITQEIKKDKCLVTGGPAENSTAWFVVIKHIE